MPASSPMATAVPSAEQESLLFTLLGSNHRNLVVYGPELQPLYHIETRRHPDSNSRTERTLVFQQDDGDQIYLIACLDFRALGDWRDDTIVYRDKRCPVAGYLPRKSDSCCRCMSTPSGEWTWTTSFGGVLKLRNANNVRMAKYQRKPFSFRPAKRTIEVEEEALPYLDAIIIGWIVVSRDIEVGRAAGSGFFPFG